MGKRGTFGHSLSLSLSVSKTPRDLHDVATMSPLHSPQQTVLTTEDHKRALYGQAGPEGGHAF